MVRMVKVFVSILPQLKLNKKKNGTFINVFLCVPLSVTLLGTHPRLEMLMLLAYLFSGS